MHKPWARRTKRVDVQGGGANHEWCTPREDVNSPDLYIPGAYNHLAFVYDYLTRTSRSHGDCDVHPPHWPARGDQQYEGLQAADPRRERESRNVGRPI